jgi:hypothetical protein
MHASESGDDHGGEPDHQVVGVGCLTTSASHRHRPPVPVHHVNPAERARPLAGRLQPPVHAVPVEGVSAGQPPGGLTGADPRQAHTALFPGAGAVASGGLCCLRWRLDAQHLGDVGEEVAHGWVLPGRPGCASLVMDHLSGL